jgi:hypothetical protein
MVTEYLKTLEENIVSMRDDLFPVLSRWVGNGRSHEAEVLRLVVRPDIEVVSKWSTRYS